MKSYTVASLFLSTAAVSHAGLTYNPGNSTFSCGVPNGAFCAGDSMGQSILVSFEKGVPAIHDCCADLNDKKAVCYQSSTDAGDACCASNGTAYPTSGSKFPIPPPPAGKNNSTSGTWAVVSSGDDECECENHPPPPPSSSTPAGGVKTSPTPPPPYKNSTAPPPPASSSKIGAVSPPPVSVSSKPPPYGTGSGYPVKSSSRPGGVALPSTWCPTPTPTPITYIVSTSPSTARSPVYTGAAVKLGGADVLAAFGFAALLL